MCINYTPVSRQDFQLFDTSPPETEWPAQTWQDYPAPFIRLDGSGRREAMVGTYGMVPQKKIPQGKRFSTMNARSETVGSLRSYSKSWREGARCLIPLLNFFEPNWETGSHVRWSIGMRDGGAFAVAGLWQSWPDEEGSSSHSFTQLTVNADGHDLMKHFHRPGHEKRSLLILPSSDWDSWLQCRDPEEARSFFMLYPAELMSATPAPKPSRD